MRTRATTWWKRATRWWWQRWQDFGRASGGVPLAGPGPDPWVGRRS